MIKTSKISERGQIIIPKEIRDEIGAGTNAIFAVSTLDKETIVMKKLNTKLLVEEFRRLRSKAEKLSPKEIEDDVDAARK